MIESQVSFSMENLIQFFEPLNMRANIPVEFEKQANILKNTI